MSGQRLSMLSLLCAVSLSIPLAAQGAGLGARLPSQRSLNRYGLTRAWWNVATMDPLRDKVAHLVADEDTVYVQSTSGIMTAFDAETGKKLWAILLGSGEDPGFPVSSNAETALVATGTTLYSVDKRSGGITWQLKLPQTPSTSPAVDSEQVYIGSLDGSVYAFDLRKIHKLYSQGRLPQWSYQALSWRYKAPKEITTPPLSNGRIVNFASRAGLLYGVSVKSEGGLVFQRESVDRKPVSAPIKASADYLYMASRDFNVYCINRNTGTTKWEFPSGRPIEQAPYVIGRHVFVLPTRGGLFCLNSDTGDRIWHQPKIKRFLAATPSIVYTADSFHNVILLARGSGQILGALPLGDYKIQLSNDQTDRLFVCTERGLVICVRERRRPFPLYYQHPERKPILPDFSPGPPPSAKPPTPN